MVVLVYKSRCRQSSNNVIYHHNPLYIISQPHSCCSLQICVQGYLERLGPNYSKLFYFKSSVGFRFSCKSSRHVKYNHYNTLDSKKVPKSTVKITLPFLEMWTKNKEKNKRKRKD